VNYRHGPKPTIGLIGGIGAGKTTAARLLAARGGRIVNADALGHEALDQPEIRDAIAARWGNGVFAPDGKLDRRAIARIVFANSHERGALEGMVFPYIRERAFAEILRAESEPTARFVVLDAAVMLEAGWEQMCDRILYVDAPRELQLARLAARSGWTEEQVASREAAQWPAADKMKRANAVVVNDGKPEHLQEQLDRQLEGWGIVFP
jgi:dephospho-CoA kinase